MNYGSRMTRFLLVLSLSLTAGLAGLAEVSVAHAGPPPPCAFALSPPQVISTSGVDEVTATLTPGECGPGATPYVSVACVQVQGDGSANDCTQARGSAVAQVRAPYRPGATYVATGRGCANWIGQPPAPNCQLLGPVGMTP